MSKVAVAWVDYPATVGGLAGLRLRESVNLDVRLMNAREVDTFDIFFQ